MLLHSAADLTEVGVELNQIASPISSVLQIISAIKLPQLIGICLGCFVFTITIATVLYLLFASGSFSRFILEVKSGKPLVLHDLNVTSNASPELHDWLLKAARTLPITPNLPELRNYDIVVRSFNSDDLSSLYEASNGSPQYHESAYDPSLFWDWLDLSNVPDITSSCKESEPDKHTVMYPSMSKDTFEMWIAHMDKDPCSCQLTIVGNEFRKPLGMIGLSGNTPKDLSICIGELIARRYG